MAVEPEVLEVMPGSFEVEDHYYPRVPNASLHPLVKGFLALGNERIAARYSHMHPEVDRDAVLKLLTTRTQVMRWAGADLFAVTDEHGVKRNVIVETNSCPSGQKSMPLRDENDEYGGYRVLIENSFLPNLHAQKGLPKGDLAVLSDKNPMETVGYARALAEITGKRVFWIPFFKDSWDRFGKFEKGVLHVKYKNRWHPIRAAIRYVTQKPWNRIPPLTKTWIYNPVLACLAGGRNKLLASKAYDLFNAEMADTGLQIRAPETIWDVALPEVPLWVKRMGGVAVVKNPYSNAGQGVYTITSDKELEAFMKLEHEYERFIVQGLIGGHGWTSRTRGGRMYQVGTVPNARGEIFVADMRMMIVNGMEGFLPVGMYARRAREPLVYDLPEGADSWSMLGTNLSIKTREGFDTEPSRLLMADIRDFNRLGIGLDDLAEAYLQTCMAAVAIDRLALKLVDDKKVFKDKLFFGLNPDPAFAEEMLLS